MSHKKRSGPPEQSTFDFDTCPAFASCMDTGLETTSRTATTNPTQHSTIVRLVDRQRERHLEVVRRLLAESGVFRVR
jgi:hypothetical protein